MYLRRSYCSPRATDETERRMAEIAPSQVSCVRVRVIPVLYCTVHTTRIVLAWGSVMYGVRAYHA